jgi:2-dehydro-3-deoxyphosphogluconate aldolase/(4S)-4-hydroxy-2-oxoglutarate aldolase
MLEQLDRGGIIAVLVIDRADHAVPVAEALWEGGVTAMELTLRTPVALDALRAIRKQVPPMLAGIGTVLSPDQIGPIQEAGAAFGVAPGVNRRVIQAAQDAGLPFAPGVVTPSDIETAVEMGCRELKFFPAELSGGLDYLRSIAAPFLHLGVRFVPLGGITESNLESYLQDPLILAAGGSWLAPRPLMENGDWGAITRRAQHARATVERVRRGNRPG